MSLPSFHPRMIIWEDAGGVGTAASEDDVDGVAVVGDDDDGDDNGNSHNG